MPAVLSRMAKEREDETSGQVLTPPLSESNDWQQRSEFMKFLMEDFLIAIMDSEAIEDKECMVCAPTRRWNIDQYKRQLKARLHNTFPKVDDPSVLTDTTLGLNTQSGRNRYIRVMFEYSLQIKQYFMDPSAKAEYELFDTLRECNVQFLKEEWVRLNARLLVWLQYQFRHLDRNAFCRSQDTVGHKGSDIGHLMDHLMPKIIDRAYKESPLTVTDGSIYDINRYKRDLMAGSPTHFPCVHLAPFEGEYRALNSAKGRRRYLYMLYRYGCQIQAFLDELVNTKSLKVCKCCRGKGVDKHHDSLLDIFKVCPRDRLETENDRLAALVMGWLTNWHNYPN